MSSASHGLINMAVHILFIWGDNQSFRALQPYLSRWRKRAGVGWGEITAIGNFEFGGVISSLNLALSLSSPPGLHGRVYLWEPLRSRD